MSTCQCRWAARGCTKPVPFLDGEKLCRSSRPAALSTRYTEAGLTATTSSREHHEGQPAIAVERVPVVVIEDGLLLLLLQPPISGHLTVVLVGLAVAGFPLVELAAPQSQPGEQASGGQFGPLGPMPDVVHDLVAGVV